MSSIDEKLTEIINTAIAFGERVEANPEFTLFSYDESDIKGTPLCANPTELLREIISFKNHYEKAKTTKVNYLYVIKKLPIIKCIACLEEMARAKESNQPIIYYMYEEEYEKSSALIDFNDWYADEIEAMKKGGDD